MKFKNFLAYRSLLSLSILAISVSVAQGAPSQRVLILGDSLTAGTFVREEQSYPSLLQMRLIEEGHFQVTLLNGGKYGKKTHDAQARLQKYLQQDPKISALMLALGANDGLRGRDLEEVKKNLLHTILFAQKNGLLVMLVGMRLPLVYPENYRLAFEKVFADLAAETQVSFLPFLLEGVGGVPELNLPDTLHPNAEGYQVVSRHVYPYLLDFLNLNR